MGEREERTLEGVEESAAAFLEEVNCDREKSGWLEGIILSVVRFVEPLERPRRPTLLAVAAQLAGLELEDGRAGEGREGAGCGRDGRDRAGRCWVFY